MGACLSTAAAVAGELRLLLADIVRLWHADCYNPFALAAGPRASPPLSALSQVQRRAAVSPARRRPRPPPPAPPLHGRGARDAAALDASLDLLFR